MHTSTTVGAFINFSVTDQLIVYKNKDSGGRGGDILYFTEVPAVHVLMAVTVFKS